MNNRSLIVKIVAALCILPALAQAVPPPVPAPEPSTIVAGALLLAPLAVGAVRAMRKPRK